MSPSDQWCDLAMTHIAGAEMAKTLRDRARGLSMDGFGFAIAAIAAKQTRIRSVAGSRDVSIAVWVDRSIDQAFPDAEGTGVDILHALESLADNLHAWHLERAREAMRAAMRAKPGDVRMAVAS